VTAGRQLPLPGEPFGVRGPRAPRIVSASRRTDLPGTYPDRLAARVRQRIEKWGEPPYGMVVWTRYPAALLVEPLRGLLEREVPNVAVNLTITGLGGTPIEPRVPRTAAALAAALEVVDLLGDPARLRWRYDPLLRGHASEDLLVRIGAPLAARGVPTVTASFPSTMSLKGPLGPQYAAAGIDPWPDLRAKVAFATRLRDRARELGLRLLWCCQPKILRDVPGTEPAQCIPLEVLERLHPGGLPFPVAKDRSQRRHCTCPPSEDIGDYALDRCRSGCAYCYSRAGGP
jgi:hypothetical protein